ncbi:MAG: TetR/AcrR family transcriptional regulator [Thermodesulfobacteriota bacterium]
MTREKTQFQNGGYTVKKHYTETFEKIAEDKRATILRVAAAEFAANGFRTANINVIARKAGISIGSMYKYFTSKENLFLTIIDHGYQVLADVLAEVDLNAGDIFDKIERLLRAAQQYSRKYPELNQIYVDIASEGLSHLSVMLSRKMESISAAFYRSMLSLSKQKGLVDAAADDFVTAFCLDNLILMLQYSYTTDYYRERMKIFAGEDALEDDERIIRGMMRFIRGALAPRS